MQRTTPSAWILPFLTIKKKGSDLRQSIKLSDQKALRIVKI